MFDVKITLVLLINQVFKVLTILETVWFLSWFFSSYVYKVCEIYGIWRVCNNVAEKDCNVLKFIHNYFKTQEMLKRCFLTFENVYNQYEVQTMCQKVVPIIIEPAKWTKTFLINILLCWNIVVIRVKPAVPCVREFPDRHPVLLKHCLDRNKISEVCEKILKCSFPLALRYAS